MGFLFSLLFVVPTGVYCHPENRSPEYATQSTKNGFDGRGPDLPI